VTTSRKRAAEIQIRHIGEDDLIQRIAGWLAERRDGRRAVRSALRRLGMRVVVGIGDDAAVVSCGRGAPPLALTTDMLVEGVHFLADHPPEALGAKAAAANLSDLAAVGAWPAWILVSLGAPRQTPARWVEAFYRGMRSVMDLYGCFCIGGDCVRAKQLTVSIAAGGNCDPRSKIPLRSRAKPGQALYVTGTLGDAGAGLWLLRGGAARAGRPRPTERDRERLIARHQRPTPRVEAGAAIARACHDAAMMDLSDGLAADLPRMAQASGCGFDIDLSALPISAPLKRAAAGLPYSAESFALFGGEDYELLFTTALPPSKWFEAVSHAAATQRAAAGQRAASGRRAAAGRPLRITRISAARRGEGVRYLDRAGKVVEPRGPIFRHF
jgi:thiamine-monophosphate kinase